MALICTHCTSSVPATSIDNRTPLWGLRLHPRQFGGYEEFADPFPEDEVEPGGILLCHDCSLEFFRFLKIPAAPVHHASERPGERCCEYGYLPEEYHAQEASSRPHLYLYKSPSEVSSEGSSGLPHER